jgi:hypothetical protein
MLRAPSAIMIGLFFAAVIISGCDQGDTRNACQKRGTVCCAVTTGPGKVLGQCVKDAEACGKLASEFPKSGNYPQSEITDAVNISGCN